MKLGEFIKNFNDMADSDKNKVFLNIPPKVLAKFYARYSNREQIILLFESWDDLVQNPKSVGGQTEKDISDLHIRKIKALIKALGKKKPHFIPDWIKDIYS